MTLTLTKSQSSRGEVYFCTVETKVLLRGRLYYNDEILSGILSASRNAESYGSSMEKYFRIGLKEGFKVDVNEKFNVFSLESDGHLWEFECLTKETLS